ncbi:MAG TPA: orotate phosphoribosyltransferase [Candidatus Methanoperedenaceae archaeon]|nr:orotate phosphoribosyltransferase [Candidatus Methanoperedenaceae archaeon]
MYTNEELRKLLEHQALLVNHDEPFVLASGIKSPYIFNVKNICFNEGSVLLADAILTLLEDEHFDYIAGMEVGAIPIISAVCTRSRSVPGRKPVNGFFVRKEAKRHGTKARIDGIRDLPPSQVIVIEDVTTTGGSVIGVINVLRSLGCTVEKVITVIDRLEGAEDALGKEGVELVALFKVGDFSIPAEDALEKNRGVQN